ncbi:hypothetical protein HU200_031177 [Digitaria exilis]|uniref:Uncharacterized protein n=1 Tax=Digitaria exilis TaxID=1010633 RepID=A0A835BVV2_9POAL|nr:hypothetical protein HU200_031177 [Digitaria exilis]
MQEWREVADRVRNTLLPIAVGTRTSHFLALVKAANLKLSTHLNFSRVILRGDTDPEIIYAAIPRLPPQDPDAINLIKLACYEYDRFRAEHAMAGRMFVLYGMCLGIPDGDPRWQTWECHHATAVRNADVALLGLRSAAARLQALLDAYDTAMSFPSGSPARIAWIKEAQSLTRSALHGVTTAAVMVRLMCRAVLRQYIAVCMLLGR